MFSTINSIKKFMQLNFETRRCWVITNALFAMDFKNVKRGRIVNGII